MTQIAKLMRAELGAKAHWSFDGVQSLCGRGFRNALLPVENVDCGSFLCRSCKSAMARLIVPAHALALEEDATWFTVDFSEAEEAPVSEGPRVQIHTGGELHPVPKMPVPDFVFNLSRLLDDPAHKPDASMVELNGLDSRVQDFVFSSDGGTELFWSITEVVEEQRRRGKSVTVLILCRGGKHRSVAFGDALAGHFSVEATHHHINLPRVLP